MFSSPPLHTLPVLYSSTRLQCTSPPPPSWFMGRPPPPHSQPRGAQQQHGVFTKPSHVSVATKPCSVLGAVQYSAVH